MFELNWSDVCKGNRVIDNATGEVGEVMLIKENAVRIEWSNGTSTRNYSKEQTELMGLIFCVSL